MALDANISIIKRLKEKYELYYFVLCNDTVKCVGDICFSANIIVATAVEEFLRLGAFLDLEKTFLVKYCSPLSIRRYLIAKEVHRAVKRIDPDIILTDAQTFPYIFERFFYRKKVVLIVHDPFPHSGENTITKKIVYRLQKFLAKKYLLLNTSQKEKFIETYHINRENVYTSFLGVYEFLYLFKTNNSPVVKCKPTFRILFFGRISPYKGVYYLLEGCKQYIEQVDRNIEVIIAGAGLYDFDISEYEICPQIKIINRFINSFELVDLIQQSDIIVCPYTDATQSGVVMSAFAFKKPVIASKVGGLPEMLEHGLLGYLISPRSVDEILKALKFLVNNFCVLRDYENNISNLYFEDGCKSWENAVKK